jgi:stage III sporulation protein AG
MLRWNVVKKVIDRVKDIISKQDKKKVMENCIIVIIIGIIIIIAGGTLFQKKDDSRVTNGEYILDNKINTGMNSDIGEKDAGAHIDSKNEGMEERLESILSQIAGAGKVSVMITYVSGSEKVPAYDKRESNNDTREEDSSGGRRTILQKDTEEKIAYEEIQNGTKMPIILKEKSPEIKGVVVVADGANEPVVRENLIRAVQTLMDIPPYKVQVFLREKR